MSKKQVVETKPLKEFSLTEFHRRGYLQEVNRCFFHPLGLALALAINDKTGEPDGRIKIWDAREDPEGFVFEHFEPAEIQRGLDIQGVMETRLKIRRETLGFGLEPLKK